MTTTTNTAVQEELSKLQTVLEAASEALDSWASEDRLPLPTLIGMVGVKLNWTESDMRENDAVVRRFVRNHKDWQVSRGAKGGAQRMSVVKAKLDAQAAKAATKAKFKAQIEASASPVTVTGDTDTATDTTNTSDVVGVDVVSDTATDDTVVGDTVTASFSGDELDGV